MSNLTPEPPARNRRSYAWIPLVLPILATLPIFFFGRLDEGSRPTLIAGLPDWFFHRTLDTARWQWLLLALLLLLTAPISNLVRASLHKLLERRFAGLQGLRESDSLVGIRRSASLLVAALLWSLLLPSLDLPSKLDQSLRFFVQTIAIAGFIWLAYSIWGAVCDGLSARASNVGKTTERLLIPVTQKLVEALILIGGFLLALSSYGINVPGVLAGLGLGGLIIALAAKDSVENFFGSLTILLDMPFAIGDWVKIGKVEGSVEQVNLRSTRIRTSEDSVITLPNSNLIRASVENLGARRHHRIKTFFSVAAQIPSGQLLLLLERLRQIIQNHSKTRKSGYQVEVYEFTLAEIHIIVNFFINANSLTEELKCRGELLIEFKKAAEELGIESLSVPAPAIPDPNEEAVPEPEDEEASPDPEKPIL